MPQIGASMTVRAAIVARTSVVFGRLDLWRVAVARHRRLDALRSAIDICDRFMPYGDSGTRRDPVARMSLAKNAVSAADGAFGSRAGRIHATGSARALARPAGWAGVARDSLTGRKAYV